MRDRGFISLPFHAVVLSKSALFLPSSLVLSSINAQSSLLVSSKFRSIVHTDCPHSSLFTHSNSLFVCKAVRTHSNSQF